MQRGNHFPGADKIINQYGSSGDIWEESACEDLASRLLQRRKSFVFGSVHFLSAPSGRALLTFSAVARSVSSRAATSVAIRLSSGTAAFGKVSTWWRSRSAKP